MIMKLKEQLSAKSINIMLFVIIFLIGLMVSLNYYDNDVYWIIAQGREILKHGIVYNNTMSINQNDKIVIQQWLYDVIIALIYDNCGDFGLYLWNFTGWLGLLVCSFIFFKNKKFSFHLNCVLATLVASTFTYLNGRPECITIILMLIECCILEQVRKEECNEKVLWFLPLIMLLEINLHASMWLFHFIIILPYVVPFGEKFGIKNTQIPFNKLWIIMLVMLIVMLLNPYGIDNVLYVFKSFTTLGKINIAELNMATMLSSYCWMQWLCIIGIIISWYKRKITSVDLFMISGITFLSFTVIRNNIFMPIALVYTIPYFNLLFLKDGNKLQQYLTKELYIMFVVIVLLLLSDGKTQLKEMSTFKKDVSENSKTADFIIDYLDKNTDKNTVRLFTGFSVGGIFEFNGYKVYMDARPELHSSKINGNDDFVDEYMSLRNSYDIKSKKILEIDDYEKFIVKYDFDYIVINNKYENVFHMYLMSQPNLYKNVCSNTYYSLYKVQR